MKKKATVSKRQSNQEDPSILETLIESFSALSIDHFNDVFKILGAIQPGHKINDQTKKYLNKCESVFNNITYLKDLVNAFIKYASGSLSCYGEKEKRLKKTQERVNIAFYIFSIQKIHKQEMLEQKYLLISLLYSLLSSELDALWEVYIGEDLAGLNNDLFNERISIYHLILDQLSIEPPKLYADNESPKASNLDSDVAASLMREHASFQKEYPKKIRQRLVQFESEYESVLASLLRASSCVSKPEQALTVEAAFSLANALLKINGPGSRVYQQKNTLFKNHNLEFYLNIIKGLYLLRLTKRCEQNDQSMALISQIIGLFTRYQILLSDYTTVVEIEIINAWFGIYKDKALKTLEGTKLYNSLINIKNIEPLSLTGEENEPENIKSIIEIIDLVKEVAPKKQHLLEAPGGVLARFSSQLSNKIFLNEMVQYFNHLIEDHIRYNFTTLPTYNQEVKPEDVEKQLIELQELQIKVNINYFVWFKVKNHSELKGYDYLLFTLIVDIETIFFKLFDLHYRKLSPAGFHLKHYQDLLTYMHLLEKFLPELTIKFPLIKSGVNNEAKFQASYDLHFKTILVRFDFACLHLLHKNKNGILVLADCVKRLNTFAEYATKTANSAEWTERIKIHRMRVNELHQKFSSLAREPDSIEDCMLDMFDFLKVFKEKLKGNLQGMHDTLPQDPQNEVEHYNAVLMNVNRYLQRTPQDWDEINLSKLMNVYLEPSMKAILSISEVSNKSYLLSLLQSSLLLFKTWKHFFKSTPHPSLFAPLCSDIFDFYARIVYRTVIKLLEKSEMEEILLRSSLLIPGQNIDDNQMIFADEVKASEFLEKAALYLLAHEVLLVNTTLKDKVTNISEAEYHNVFDIEFEESISLLEKKIYTLHFLLYQVIPHTESCNHNIRSYIIHLLWKTSYDMFSTILDLFLNEGIPHDKKIICHKKLIITKEILLKINLEYRDLVREILQSDLRDNSLIHYAFETDFWLAHVSIANFPIEIGFYNAFYRISDDFSTQFKDAAARRRFIESNIEKIAYKAGHTPEMVVKQVEVLKRCANKLIDPKLKLTLFSKQDIILLYDYVIKSKDIVNQALSIIENNLFVVKSLSNDPAVIKKPGDKKESKTLSELPDIVSRTCLPEVNQALPLLQRSFACLIELQRCFDKDIARGRLTEILKIFISWKKLFNSKSNRLFSNEMSSEFDLIIHQILTISAKIPRSAIQEPKLTKTQKKKLRIKNKIRDEINSQVVQVGQTGLKEANQAVFCDTKTMEKNNRETIRTESIKPTKLIEIVKSEKTAAEVHFPQEQSKIKRTTKRKHLPTVDSKPEIKIKRKETPSKAKMEVAMRLRKMKDAASQSKTVNPSLGSKTERVSGVITPLPSSKPAPKTEIKTVSRARKAQSSADSKLAPKARVSISSKPSDVAVSVVKSPPSQSPRNLVSKLPLLSRSTMQPTQSTSMCLETSIPFMIDSSDPGYTSVVNQGRLPSLTTWSSIDDTSLKDYPFQSEAIFMIIGKIALPSRVKSAMMALFRANFMAYVVGGFPRDRIIGNNLIPNDIDVKTNCPSHLIQTIVGNDCINNRSNPDGALFNIYDGSIPIDLSCVESSNGALADKISLESDLTINSVVINLFEDILVRQEVLKDFQSKEIVIIGDPEARIKKDPSIICRSIRIATRVKKDIPHHYKDIFLNNAPSLTYLPFGVILKILQTFCRGNAKQIFFKLYDEKILPHFLPIELAKCHQQFKVPEILKSFWEEELYKIDQAFEPRNRYVYYSYQFLAMIMLVNVIFLYQRMKSDFGLINQFFIYEYIKTYKGSFKHHTFFIPEMNRYLYDYMSIIIQRLSFASSQELCVQDEPPALMDEACSDNTILDARGSFYQVPTGNMPPQFTPFYQSRTQDNARFAPPPSQRSFVMVKKEFGTGGLG